eukprot:TRINITY_DN10634_c0_g1_i1.p1 TRINITY_DN10634_c0_g1~~TRINITY_DN10634_c0_g1_i1.p1  ORF type:complete len:251 (+),score=-37.02 TRINITY_DN10634_c0_g1_i1:314-1066(+)
MVLTQMIMICLVLLIAQFSQPFRLVQKSSKIVACALITTQLLLQMTTFYVAKRYQIFWVEYWSQHSPLQLDFLVKEQPQESSLFLLPFSIVLTKKSMDCQRCLLFWFCTVTSFATNTCFVLQGVATWDTISLLTIVFASLSCLAKFIDEIVRYCTSNSKMSQEALCKILLNFVGRVSLITLVCQFHLDGPVDEKARHSYFTTIFNLLDFASNRSEEREASNSPTPRAQWFSQPCHYPLILSMYFMYFQCI